MGGGGTADGQLEQGEQGEKEKNSEIVITFSKKKVFRLLSERWGGVSTVGGLQVMLAPILGPTREPGLSQQIYLKSGWDSFLSNQRTVANIGVM